MLWWKVRYGTVQHSTVQHNIVHCFPFLSFASSNLFILSSCLLLHTHTYMHTHTHSYMHTHTYIHTHTHTYIHTHIHTHSHIHAHTHIQVESNSTLPRQLANLFIDFSTNQQKRKLSVLSEHLLYSLSEYTILRWHQIYGFVTILSRKKRI